MFLVYEKNYNMGGDIDCVEKCDMKLFANKKNALADMEKRKEEYIEDNDFRYVKDESYEDALCFKEQNGDGYFYICMVELECDTSKEKDIEKPQKNKYIVRIDRADDEDPWMFVVSTDETKDYVKSVIVAAQDEFHFEDPCKLLDYVCDTYEFAWSDFVEDIYCEMN